MKEIECIHCKEMIKRKDMDNHIMFCDYVKLNCEAYPKCKLEVYRKDFFDHTSACQEVKIECKGICGQLIRRKFWNEAEHECINYLKYKL